MVDFIDRESPRLGSLTRSGLAGSMDNRIEFYPRMGKLPYPSDKI